MMQQICEMLGVNGPRKFKRSFSTRIKVFRSTTVREYLHERDRLKRLQHVANVEDNQNPLSLLKVLLNSQSTPSKAKGRSSIIDEISRAFLKVLKFVFRVVLVMGVLYTAAVLFAYLEDQGSHTASKNNTFDVEHDYNNDTSPFWRALQNHYLIELKSVDRKVVEGAIKKQIESIKVDRKHASMNHGSGSRHLKIQKWLYFVIIASTTIGYGDVCPKTQNGKTFYCCFSVVGIVLMMSLLRSCSAIITSINKRFYWLIRLRVCPRIKYISEELASLILALLLFAMFLTLGIWHDSMDDSSARKLVDIIYFWIVTFTTVGFGDIGHSLEFEIEHAYELTVYRVIGLSMIAAIIESIMSYVDMQQKTIQRETEAYQRKILEKLQMAVERSKSFHHRDDRQKGYSIKNGLKQFAIPPGHLKPNAPPENKEMLGLLE